MRKSPPLFFLALFLAQAPMLGLDGKLASAHAQQGPIRSYKTSSEVTSVPISSDGSYIAAGGG